MDEYEDTYKKLANLNLSEAEQDQLLKTALTNFDAARPEPLIELLSSQDGLVRRLGLHVYGWLGDNSFPALNAALLLVNETSDWARGYILDGVLCYPKKLNANQASIVISMAADPFVVVRSKVAAFIGCIDIEVLEQAIALLSSLPNRSEYNKGLSFNRLGASALSILLTAAFDDKGASSTFALGAIDRLARAGQIDELPTYQDENLDADLLLGNANRLITRRKRISPLR